VNANFAALNSELTLNVTAAQNTGVSIFKEKNGANLVFKTLVSGTKMSLNDTGNSIVVNSTAADAFTRFDTDSGTVLANNFQQITLAGTSAPGSTTSRKDIEVTAFGSSIRFKTIIPVTDILTSYDFGFINGQFNNAMQAIYAASNMDFGTAALPGRVDLDCGTIV
jgi:hypothetical protein